MMRTIQHTVCHVVANSGAAPTESRVTLPAPPWAAEFTRDRADTEPRTRPIRGRDWRGWDRLLTRAHDGFWR